MYLHHSFDLFHLCSVGDIKSVTIGSWRSIYSGSLLSTPFEVRDQNLREYFVPEMYLKEREIRKIELGLKEVE